MTPNKVNQKRVKAWMIVDDLQSPCFDDVFTTRRQARDYLEAWGDPEYRKEHHARIIQVEIVPLPSSPKKKTIKVSDSNHCPRCGCLYDDKMIGAQGRNGLCECSCGHRSSPKNKR